MNLDPSEIEIKVAALSQRVTVLESRLRRLESGVGPGGEPVQPEPVLSPRPERTFAAGGLVPLVGRTLVALGGAFLIRAITENHTIPEKAGVALGVAYSFAWLLMAGRDGARSRAGATFHGLTSALILFPLVWEATARFHFLTPEIAALTLTAAAVLALVAAGRGGLGVLAATFALGSAALSMVLVPATGRPLPFAAGLLTIGLAGLWHGYLSGGNVLARLLAGIVDLWILMLLIFRLLTPGPAGPLNLQASQMVAVQLGLVVIYLTSFALRTLFKGREITNAEIIQSAAALVIGFGGAVAVTGVERHSFLPLGAAGLVFGLLNYGVAFAFIGRGAARGRNFHFYSTLALLFTLAALPLLFRGPALGAALSVGAVGAAVLGASGKRPAFSLHGSVYAISAVATSGLLRAAGLALSGMPGAGSPGPMALLALAATSVAAWIAPPRDSGEDQRLRKLPKSLTLAVVAIAAGGCVVDLVCRIGGYTPSEPVGIVAGTAVLSLIAVGLAWLGRWDRFIGALPLVYPALAVAGLKVVARDLTTRRSAVIFASLALYGTALILAPRILKASRARKENRDRPAG